jgi:hypothetical protein
MIAQGIDKILELAKPNFYNDPESKLQYSDKPLELIAPPLPPEVQCSTLQGLVDLCDVTRSAGIRPKLLAHITSPVRVEVISAIADLYGRRQLMATAHYPPCETFRFGYWLDPETFIIAVQQGFQRVSIENGDGSLAPDLDYVLNIASKISAESATDYADDGFTQQVAIKKGVALKSTIGLKPMVNLAPYRTFAEIDQVVSSFVFRARVTNNAVSLALFEGDGGRWKLAAIQAIKDWLQPKFGEDVPVIS